MKNIAIAFVSLFATAAFACPDLTGTYQCEKDQNDSADTGVISVVVDSSTGSTVYSITDKDDGALSTLPTDGQTYQDGEYTYTGSCVAESFNMVVTGVDAQIGAYTVTLAYTLDATKNLVGSGDVKFNYGGQPQQQPINNTCKRL